MGERVESGDIDDDLRRQSDGDGVDTDGKGCRTGGATSGARRESKRLETRPLAEVEMDQHGQRHHTTEYTPRPSIPPPRYARSLSAYVDPPRRRGRLKSRPRSISTSRRTYQVTWTRRSRIRRIGCVGYVVYSQEMVQERYRVAKREDEATRAYRGRARALGQRDH